MAPYPQPCFYFRPVATCWIWKRSAFTRRVQRWCNGFPAISSAWSVERGVLGLASFLQIAPKIYPDDFRLLSQPHIDAPFITTAAYLPVVPADERESFEQLQEEWHGYIGFRIRDYQRGQPLTRGKQDHHFPILMFEPRTVVSLGMLGRDLSTCKDIETVLQRAIDTAATTIAFGDKESCIKNLVALKPVYHGRQPPNQVSERKQGIKGFVKLDLDSRRLLQLESGKHLQVKLEAEFAESPLVEWNSDDTSSQSAIFKVFSDVRLLSGVFNDQLRLRITKTIEWSGMQYMLLFLSAAIGLMFTLFIHRFSLPIVNVCESPSCIGKRSSRRSIIRPGRWREQTRNSKCCIGMPLNIRRPLNIQCAGQRRPTVPNPSFWQICPTNCVPLCMRFSASRPSVRRSGKQQREKNCLVISPIFMRVASVC
ncbi:MAG: hypothetical protein DIZ78_08345 [endosymbiont of Escarpia spicata]|uniref:CHASE domain-containing protein n=1 Tax=endosymbiont of Escarpia spicata TaxID=2200908 RepID=A0A370DMR3_9GAMM|nr:MAG: hypothetical protein DIZ78_08345 [endosymbiont of Escarpia spicata]